jgi:hypothetical protein
VNKHKKQFRIGLITLAIISLHIILCLYFLFAPAQFRVRNRMVNLYGQLMLLGPFFTESKIKSTIYLSLRHKQNGVWSASRNLSREHLAVYRNNPWRWDMLSQIGYETHLTFSISDLAKGKSFEAIKNGSTFQELNGFLMQEFIPTPVDSVQIIGQMENYIPKSRNYLLDTTFVFTYNPASIGDAKK